MNRTEITGHRWLVEMGLKAKEKRSEIPQMATRRTFPQGDADLPRRGHRFPVVDPIVDLSSIALVTKQLALTKVRLMEGECASG